MRTCASADFLDLKMTKANYKPNTGPNSNPNANPGPYKPRTGHTGRTGRILYTWPYYRPSKEPSNCPKC